MYDSNREKNEYNTAYESLIAYRKINEERMKDTITDRLNKLLNGRTIDNRELEQREKLKKKMRM